MTDVEFITEVNHRRARERELGRSWNEIERLQRKQAEVKKMTETFCFSIACMLIGASAVMLGLGLLKAAIALFGASVCFFTGAILTGS